MVLINWDFGVWNRIQFVLLVFIDSLLAIIQLSMFLSSWFPFSYVNVNWMAICFFRRKKKKASNDVETIYMHEWLLHFTLVTTFYSFSGENNNHLDPRNLLSNFDQIIDSD